MKRKVKTILISTALYFSIMGLGLLLVCVFQNHAHADLSTVAKSAAEQYLQSGQVTETGNRANICVFFCAKGEDAYKCLYNDVDYEIYQNELTRCIARYKSHNSLLQIRFVLFPLNFFAIASAPVYDNGNLLGSVYVIRLIRYLPDVIKLVVAFYTLVYLFVHMWLYLRHRANNRIMDIYKNYIANVSHELKTPVASIRAITETLSAGLVRDESTLSRYYRIVDQESRRLEQSIVDIIELSKIQDRQNYARKQVVSLSDVLDPMCNRYFEFCEDVGIRFTVDSSVHMIPKLYTDPKRFIQLLQILLDNAVKFTGDGGEIVISVTRRDKKAVFQVRDTGCGMDSDVISHIFERFYRGPVPGNYTGSGLGLSIAKEITESLKERIWVESQPGIGSSFFFTISCKNR